VTGEKGLLSSLLAVAVTDTKNVFDEEGGGDVDKEEVELYNYSQSAIKDQDLDLSVNIWDEPPDSLENFVVTLSEDGKKKTVQSASFNKLIEWLTSERNVDLDFRKVFLLTYPMFVSSEGFLHKLIERYFVDDRQIPSGAPTDFKKKLAFRVVSCVKSWISTNPSDWNEVLSNTLLDFVDNYLSPDGFNDFAQNLRSSLAKKDEDRSTTDFGNNYLDPKLPKGVSLFSPSLTLKDIPEEEIARQLTLMDKAIYDAIKPHELLSGNWYRRRYASFNVIAMIEHFNDLAAWVATTILRTPTVKERSKVVCRFITICEVSSPLPCYSHPFPPFL
jgi:hypothetical protein